MTLAVELCVSVGDTDFGLFVCFVFFRVVGWEPARASATFSVVGTYRPERFAFETKIRASARSSVSRPARPVLWYNPSIPTVESNFQITTLGIASIFIP